MKPNGFVFYRGPSMLDGKPIVAILTGINKRSANSKTGKGLFQTWILREDINPIKAVNNGADVSICGDCKFRGVVVRGRNKGRSCYVRLDTAPSNVWKTYKRGRYPILTGGAIRELIAGGSVRSGSYGDPAAVPFHVWENMLLQPGTAYTHQWRQFPELASFCMASVDTSAERAEAKLLGFRTFRVRGELEPVEDYEVICPASIEAGHKTTCDACRACGGTRAKARADIVITVHGNGKAKNFMEAVQMTWWTPEMQRLVWEYREATQKNDGTCYPLLPKCPVCDQRGPHAWNCSLNQKANSNEQR